MVRRPSIVLFWQFEPVPLSGIVTLSVAYALGVGPLRRRLAPGVPLPVLRALSFAIAMLIAFLVVSSPLHLLAEAYLLSAHMLQLSLLIYVVPPLLLTGLPPWLLRPALAHPQILPWMRCLTRPWIAFILFQLVFIGWHVPAVFRTVLTNETLHGLSYLVLVTVSVLMWWPIMGELRGLSRPPLATRFAYVLALLLAHLPVMGVMTMAQEPLYPWYATAPRVFGLSPMADQQLGSAVMMVITLLALLVPLCAIGLRWLAAADDGA
jgi:putative membrane protein